MPESSTLNTYPGEELQEPMSQVDILAFTTAISTPGTYTLGPDSTEQDGVPRGTLTQHRWTDSRR